MVLGRSAGPVIMMVTELCRSLNFKLQRDVAHLRRNEEVRMKMMEDGGGGNGGGGLCTSLMNTIV